MAAPQHDAKSVSQDTLITIKVQLNGEQKKLKLPLRDLGASVLPDKLRHCLHIKPEQTAVFERFSDSAGGFITLDPSNVQVFKTLIRAAKAKLKLRLKATVTPVEPKEEEHITATIKETVAAPAVAPLTAQPTIVRTPLPARDSTALDRRSVGSGIFQFREAIASQQTLVDTDEAPVPQPFVANPSTSQPNLAFGKWNVFCNACDRPMLDAHFHCSICSAGDYDLCEGCVASGKTCPGDLHWLIKRYVRDGKVISSSTERISPRKVKAAEPTSVEVEKTMPGAFTEDAKILSDAVREPTRTCNSCVVILPEQKFVTCTVCEDFDLCVACHVKDKHGHHPAHGFKPATKDTMLPLAAEPMLAPGRNTKHNALCDGCDKKIYGVRHKCLNCPDFDFCNDCVGSASAKHPGHRFAPLYQPIAEQAQMPVRHYGIYCDGPLCNNKHDQSYITGVRYKCAVCHDTDFCASCEALPSNTHNRTHPLIKFKTPVRNVSITTENEDLRGHVRTMGDRRAAPAQAETKSTAAETTPVQQINAATQVQTVAEIKPVEVTQPIAIAKPLEKTVPATEVPTATLLNAHFVRDFVPDGQVVQPGSRFTQIWTLRNPGPFAWPAGCSVRYVGGDNMLNVDNDHPASVIDIANASESNVVGRAVEVNEEVAFKITLKAPVREGKAISYWRVKAADGTPFGHRLWCDIEVKTPELPSPAAVPTPAAFAAPFLAARQAKAAREQAMLQQQAIRMQQLEMMQQQMKLQSEQAARLRAAQPPSYESILPSVPARFNDMRIEQQRRRDQMVTQLRAQRDQLQAQGIKREDMPSLSQHINPTVGNKQTLGTAIINEEKERKDAAKLRVEHIKAKILKARQEHAKQAEAALKQTELSDAKQAEAAKVQKIIEQVNKDTEAKEGGVTDAKDNDMEGSQMVFPKLEKESPASSTYQSATSSTIKAKAAYVENEHGEVERSASPAAAPVAVSEPAVTTPMEEGFEDLTDDLEVLSADGEVSEDDGFMTDEEYDILDASDQETVASP